MALSSSEHALLEETCINMNQAANTCRDVLEMLRSLGNSGVVDIATHNNATDAHANVDSIAKINTTNNSFAVGKNGDAAAGLFSGAPFRVAPYGTGSGKANGLNAIIFCSETHGLSNFYPQAHWYHYETDSSGSLDSEANAMSGQLAWHYTFSSNGTQKTHDTSFRVLNNNVSHNSSLVVTLKSSSSTSNSTFAYAFEESAFYPLSSLSIDIGKSTSPFNTAFFASAATVSSDSRGKKDVSSLDHRAVEFIKSIRPVEFKYSVSKSYPLSSDDNGNAIEIERISGIRTHWGFIAQEVKEALTQAGIEDAAVWCLADKDDPDSRQALRYEELIAPLVKAVQVLAAKVEALGGK